MPSGTFDNLENLLGKETFRTTEAKLGEVQGLHVCHCFFDCF
jgi:hypothetical protein